MVTANLVTFLGFGFIATALVVVFFSAYRRWLGFLMAGMIFWVSLEGVRYTIQTLFELPITYSYLSALALAMMAVTFILLREDRAAQQALANRQCIEHTPVYDEPQSTGTSRS